MKHFYLFNHFCSFDLADKTDPSWWVIDKSGFKVTSICSLDLIERLVDKSRALRFVCKRLQFTIQL